MRKTLLRSSLLGFVAAVLLLAGCESPTSFDVSYGNIGSVQNLKVTPYTGVNLLTWDPVADADTYNIYRKEKPADKDWGEFVELKSNISAINYPDIIKDDNILTDSSEYTYRVIAKSRNEVLSSSSTEVSYKTDTAKFPAATPQFPSKGTALSVTITDATIQADNTYGIATLTWTASIDNPAIEYKVTSSNNNQWGIQEGTTVATQSINNTGFADAQILASFTTGYYPASAAVYVDPVAYNVQHLDSITDVSITSATRTGNTNQAIITYTKVTGATAYVLQKALSNNNVAGVLTWEDVGTTGAVDLGTSYQVTDTVTPERWQYRLFVRTANGISQPSYFMVSKVTESVTGYASASRQLKTADSTTDDLDNAIYEIDFSISDVTEGATYRLQYRKIGTSNQDNANDVAEVGEWTLGPSVTPTGADLSNKKFHIYFTPPAQRQGYQYRIVGTAEGKSANTPISIISITNGISVLNGGYIGNDYNIYAFAVKSKLELSSINIPDRTHIEFTLTGAQPNETIQVYAQKQITDNVGRITVEDPVIHLGTITAAAVAPTSLTIPSPGTDGTPTGYTYEWTNWSVVYTAK